MCIFNKRFANPEKIHSASPLSGSKFDYCLTGEVLGALNGGHDILHREESRQIGCIGGDQDEGEEPPAGSQRTRGDCHGGQLTTYNPTNLTSPNVDGWNHDKTLITVHGSPIS